MPVFLIFILSPSPAIAGMDQWPLYDRPSHGSGQFLWTPGSQDPPGSPLQVFQTPVPTSRANMNLESPDIAIASSSPTSVENSPLLRSSHAWEQAIGNQPALQQPMNMSGKMTLLSLTVGSSAVQGLIEGIQRKTGMPSGRARAKEILMQSPHRYVWYITVPCEQSQRTLWNLPLWKELAMYSGAQLVYIYINKRYRKESSSLVGQRNGCLR